jgi:hypothetical protein
MNEKENLIRRIAEVFPVQPIPDRSEILPPDAYKDPDWERIKDFFGGRPWTAITPQDVFRFRDALSAFSAKAFAYFAAAWMTCSLLDEEAVDTAIEDLIFSIARAHRSTGRRDVNLWSDEQKAVICEWIKYFEAKYGDSEIFVEDCQAAYRNLACGG